ncbi:MAG: sigma-70 family RNA polymerase sigma factor [bacterium]|nr:sigma-70 family RNA polymerase sigma factor [bacterium]
MEKRREPSLEEIEALIEKGKEEGFVTYSEIEEIFTPLSIWHPHLEDLFSRLEERNIEVIEEEPIGKVIEGKEVVKDSVRAYLEEIGQIPLLTHEQEVEIAKKIERLQSKIRDIEVKFGVSTSKLKRLFKGWRDKNIKKEAFPKALQGITEEEIQHIIQEIDRLHDEVSKNKQRFVEANLRLVIKVAKKYANQGLPFLDLINEGNIGLMRAVDKFDYKQGYKFSTYAIWWIKHAITRAIAEKARTIRVPVYILEVISKFIKITRNLVQELGREPRLSEIAERMKMDVAKIIEIANVVKEPDSLESPVGEEGNIQLGDLIEDKKILSPGEITFLTILKEQISKLLDRLRENEKEVIRLRYGIDGALPHTLEEVGKVMGLTRERVRQIERDALKKLRSFKISKELHDFLIE